MTQAVEASVQAAHEPSPSVAPTSGPTARPWLPAALAAGAGIVVLSLLLLLWFGLAQREAGSVGESRVPLRQAPDFELGLFTGGTFRLADQRASGRPVLVNFWASWCGPCADEAPVLEAGWQRYSDRVAFVGVDVQDVDADALAFLQKFGVSYPNGSGNAGPISIAYGMRGVPESYVVARDGRILRKWNGALSTAALDQYLGELLRADAP